MAQIENIFIMTGSPIGWVLLWECMCVHVCWCVLMKECMCIGACVGGKVENQLTSLLVIWAEQRKGRKICYLLKDGKADKCTVVAPIIALIISAPELNLEGAAWPILFSGHLYHVWLTYRSQCHSRCWDSEGKALSVEQPALQLEVHTRARSRTLFMGNTLPHCLSSTLHI